MALSEIEKLERRYAENPQGLTFAPLAEVHRKNGEVERALNLLGSGLEIHPDYIPASIVLGRCHMDLGDVQAAETAFLHVLDLDGENVIALKALADISERLLRFDDAERWLHTLLTVDRSNDDAREQLQRVEIARRQAGVASSAEPSSVLETPAGAEAAAEVAVPPIPDIAPSPPPFQPPTAEPGGGSIGFADLEPSAMDLEPSGLRDEMGEGRAGIQLDEPGRFEESVEPLDGLVGREVDTPDEVVADLTGAVGDFRGDFRVETSEDIILRSAGGSEFQMPDASQELFAGGAKGERAPFEEDAPVSPSAAWEAPKADGAAEPVVSESEQRTPEPDMQEPEPEIPEPEQAVEGTLEPEAYTPAPYQPEPYAPEPYTPEPYTPEPYTPEPSAPEPPTPEAPAPEPVAAQPTRAYGVAATGGQSVVQLFKGILAARPPAQASAAAVRQPPPAGTAGAPTRPAADALSLSSVFGDETSETPPAVPTQNPGAGSVSFDDFFGSSSPSPAARTPRTPDPKNDDLDQFHAWLQNLKR